MLMNRLSPFELLDEMQSTFGLLDNVTAGARPFFAPAYPPVNAWSDESNFYVEAEIPGIPLDDLEISIADGQVLSIEGQRKECACEGGKWLRRERGCGAFQRRIELPGPVDQKQIEASLKQGVLTITLPKAASVRPRRIEVKAS